MINAFVQFILEIVELLIAPDKNQKNGEFHFQAHFAMGVLTAFMALLVILAECSRSYG